MTDVAITALAGAVLAAVPPTMVAWAALRQSKRNAGKADVLIEKAVEIHTLTNSNLTAVKTALEVANAKIEGLQKLVEAQNKTAPK